MPLGMESITLDRRTESRPASRFAGMRVHFVGIGGCGMSGLARILHDSGAIVSGSDPHPSSVTRLLEDNGITVTSRQDGALLSPDVDLVVLTAAIPPSNPEYLLAQRLGIPTIKYAQLLGQVMAERFGVAVAGTHGKSTTTAMIAYALTCCGADPSFVVGGTVRQLGGGSHSGSGPAFIVEACEYDRSFHNLHPTVALLMNIEADHLDCYRDIDEIVESFGQFAALVPSDGLILANGADARVAEAISACQARVQTVGLRPGYDWSTRPIGVEAGCYRGTVEHEGKIVATLTLSVPGMHNLFNATMALAACVACGVPADQAADALGQFTGVDRRMSEMGHFNGAVVVDDYGHHPTEISVTLQALRGKYAPRKLWCVFQPHQHSRTRFLLEDFACSFASADETIMPDIYFVRDSEMEKQRVSAADLVRRIGLNGQSARHIPAFADIVDYLRRHVQPGDLVVTMGAGNVWEIGRDLVE